MAEMTEVAKGVATHQRLVALLTQENARYRVVNHEAVGKCEAVSEIRGTALGQGAKALVCKVKGNGVNQHVSCYSGGRSASRPLSACFTSGRLTRFPCQPGGSRYADRLRFLARSRLSVFTLI